MRGQVQLLVLIQLLIGFQIGETMYRTIGEFDRFEVEYSALGDFSKLRITKYNRTTPVINGTYDIAVDLDDSYELGVTCARSALGNNQYNTIPLKLSSMPVCQFFKTYAYDYQYMYLNKSNFPQVPREGMCPFPKGTYWIKNVALDASALPPVLPDGYYRCYLDVCSLPERTQLLRQAYYARIYKELIKY
ncbi:uncharacterized protein LOC131688259 [Topomyia yanbarensis]|uniref:uncharacterized protein LOC131688259 n=1 Tax=Topomyia yanbarensis TaxID=2498891 RepID=UPI00273C373A|nr:uncharacterized protein LOC131688259 [Topomyia yanbarensis]